jgi:hypothetical protein
MLDAVHRSFIQDEAHRQRPVNTQFELIRLYVDLNVFNLLTDSAAKSADIIRKSYRLPFVSRRELIMGQRDRVDATRDVIQSTMDLRTLGPTLLDGNGGQNKLKVVFHSVLHFTK